MSTHKDLPPSSQKWAGDVDAGMKRIADLEEIVRRLTENAGIDFANPKRGINTGNTPSIKSPVGQKLSSLADVSTYDVLDGYVLTWDQREQKWLPKAKAGGNVVVTPADTWSVPEQLTNLYLDPSFETELSRQGWIGYAENNNAYINVETSIVPGAGRDGGSAMKIDFYYINQNFASNWVKVSLRNLPVGTGQSIIWVQNVGATRTIDATMKTHYDTQISTSYDSASPAPGTWVDLRTTSGNGPTVTRVDLELALEPVIANAGPTSILVDTGYIGPSMGWDDVFTGSTPSDADYSYAWTGATNASTSTRTENRRIKVPSVITQGGVAQFLGEGWVPGELAMLGMDNRYHAQVTVGPDGKFDYGLAIPAYIDDRFGVNLFAENEPYSASMYVPVTLAQ